MKRVLLFLIGILPIMLSAQDKCVYFEKMVKLEVEKTELNTAESDFGPAFVANELYHSAYSDEKLDKLARGKKRKIHYDAFTSTIDENGNVTGGRSMHLAEHSEGYHVGPVAFCEKTGEIFVTISNFENPKSLTKN